MKLVQVPYYFVQRNNARVIADSILALHRGNLISNPLDDPHVTSELQEQGASLSQGGGASEGGGVNEGEVALPQDKQNWHYNFAEFLSWFNVQ